jgi:hypothetical protein
MKRVFLVSCRIVVGVLAVIGVVAIGLVIRLYRGVDTHSQVVGAPDPTAALRSLAGEWRVVDCTLPAGGILTDVEYPVLMPISGLVGACDRRSGYGKDS